MNPDVRLGTQSWSYRSWVTPFYPPGTPPDDFLPFYDRVFRTVEVDATFYAVPAEPVLRDWGERVTPGFQFTLKVPQQITHERRLVEVDAILEKFVARARVLGSALGPLLLQMSPDFLPTRDHRALLRTFLATLPRDLRWAVEFRNHRWITTEMLDELRRHRVALALTEGRWHRREQMLALLDDPTADFHYIRWMGVGRSVSDFSKPQVDRGKILDAWAGALKSAAPLVETIYGYFNNQFEGHAPHSVRELQGRLGVEVVDPESLHPQRDLFQPAASLQEGAVDGLR